MPMEKASTKTENSPALLNSRVQIKGRRMSRMAVSTLFQLDQNALGVKALDT